MSSATLSTSAWYALLALAGMAAVIAIVLGFEHIGGYIPCKLCLEQRTPYYFAMPVALVAAFGAWRGWPPLAVRALLVAAALFLAYSALLGGYHAGVEWGWWQGPADCGAVGNATSSDVNDLLADLSRTRPPACDEAAGRFLGLSFAGWNVLASAGLAAVLIRGATK